MSYEITSQIPAFRRTLQREMADYQQRVADSIIRAREKAGYDREPFALRAGISVKQLRRIEQGKSSPRLGTIRKIADTAGVPITDIRPDLDEEEEAIRAQLDRIEKHLENILAFMAEEQAERVREARRRRGQGRKPAPQARPAKKRTGS